jgi:hypothetical protein
MGEVMLTFVAGQLVYDKYGNSGMAVIKNPGRVLLSS